MADETQGQYIHDYESVHANVVRARTVESSAAFLLPHLSPGMSLLDCGCGPGTITVGLAETVAPGEVVGLDMDESQVGLARDRAAELGLTNFKVETGDIYGLTFPDNTFDAAFSHAVFEHLSNPLRAAQETLRVLKPNGVFGVRTADYMGVIYMPTSEPFESAVDIYMKFRQHNGGNPFVGRQLRSILRDAGFANVQWSASYDVWSTPEQIKAFTDVILVEMTGPLIRERAVQMGWATLKYFDEIVEAINDWGQHPDAIFAISLCEVVGWTE